MNTESMSVRNTADIIVIGGGAAGMTAALFAARQGAKVVLLEKNEKLGKKIYITGKGRCNVTNDCDIEEFLKNVTRNPRFLNSAIRRFTPQDMIALLAELGLETKVERGARVYPVSEKASDVTRALAYGMRKAGVEVCLNTEAASVRPSENGVAVELKDGRTMAASAVITATGGISYPSTGSTGDGYRFAQENGHTVQPTRGALVGLVIDEKWPQLLQGLALKNVRLTAQQGKKKLYNEMGEMLFTHFGVSGPLCIELSNHLPDDPGDTRIELDMKPALTIEQIDERLQREFRENNHSQIKTILIGLMPSRMAPVFAAVCGIDPEKPVHDITKEERRKIGTMLKALPLKVTGYRSVDEAIVTRGGITVSEIRPGTMESKLTPGLYFAGEVLDIDAHTGGFNLQIAFATGMTAGTEAAKQVLEQQKTE